MAAAAAVVVQVAVATSLATGDGDAADATARQPTPAAATETRRAGCMASHEIDAVHVSTRAQEEPPQQHPQRADCEHGGPRGEGGGGGLGAGRALLFGLLCAVVWLALVIYFCAAWLRRFVTWGDCALPCPRPRSFGAKFVLRVVDHLRSLVLNRYCGLQFFAATLSCCIVHNRALAPRTRC
jgi:hypothetical protein